MYRWGIVEHRYFQFQRPKEFELGGGVTFNILAKSDDWNAGGVIISAQKYSVWFQLQKWECIGDDNENFSQIMTKC